MTSLGVAEFGVAGAQVAIWLLIASWIVGSIDLGAAAMTVSLAAVVVALFAGILCALDALARAWP
jgi:hypothetical protein